MTSYEWVAAIPTITDVLYFEWLAGVPFIFTEPSEQPCIFFGFNF